MDSTQKVKKKQVQSSPSKKKTSSSQSPSSSNHVRHQQVNDSLSQEEASILSPKLESPLSDYHYDYEQEIVLEEESTPPPPIVGPPIDYDYSESFTDMVKAIINKNRKPTTSSSPEATSQVHQQQKERQQSSGESDQNNDVEEGQRAVYRELEERSADSSEVLGSMQQARLPTEPKPNETTSRVEQSRRDSNLNLTNDEQADALALGLPLLDAFSDEENESFNQLLARIAKEYPLSPSAQLPDSIKDEKDDLINSLLNFDEEEDDNDNNVTHLPTIPAADELLNHGDQQIENPRRMERANLSQELFQFSNSLNDPLLLANYSILGNIHPWLYNTDIYDASPPPILQLSDPEEEEEEEEPFVVCNYISRYPRSLDDFEYISQREWELDHHQQQAEQQVEAFDRLSVSPQRHPPHHRLGVQQSSSRRGSGSSSYRNGGSSDDSHNGNNKKQKSKRIFPLTSHDVREQKDDSWASEADFTQLLNWDSNNEMFRGLSFVQKEDQASAHDSSKGKQKAILQEEVQSYHLFEENEPDTDLLLGSILVGGGFYLPTHENKEDSPPSDIEKYIIATSTPNEELELFKKLDKLEKPAARTSNMSQHQQPQCGTRQLLPLSPNKAPPGLVSKDLFESEFIIGKDTEQQQKRKVDIASSSPTKSPQRRRIQPPCSNKIISPCNRIDENASAATTATCDTTASGKEGREPFEFRTRRKAAAEKNDISPRATKPSKKDDSPSMDCRRKLVVSLDMDDAYDSSPSPSTERRRRLIAALDDDHVTSNKSDPSSHSKQKSCKENK